MVQIRISKREHEIALRRAHMKLISVRHLENMADLLVNEPSVSRKDAKKKKCNEKFQCNNTAASCDQSR
jgi:hypothetical protein